MLALNARTATRLLNVARRAEGPHEAEGEARTPLNVPVYEAELWTSRQRQANSIHEISYRACFKPQLQRAPSTRCVTKATPKNCPAHIWPPSESWPHSIWRLDSLRSLPDWMIGRRSTRIRQICADLNQVLSRERPSTQVLTSF